jgi:hypothetical protein
MSRDRQRATLEDGFRLDLNRLKRAGLLRPGAWSGWEWKRDGETIGVANLSVALHADGTGCLRLNLGSLHQIISLTSDSRRFGGCQWYFVCPRTDRRVSVLWMPPGARSFASRHAWKRQVAYRSQFLGPDDRAWYGKHKIKRRLIGDLDSDEWDLPPKPKRMRWSTYARYERRFDRYEYVLDAGLCALAMRFGWLGKMS